MVTVIMEVFNEKEFACSRELISSFEFIGHISGNNRERIMRAIEIVTKKEVAIKFCMSTATKESYEYLIAGLINHKAFPEYFGSQRIGNAEAHVFEYVKGKSLKMFVVEEKALSESFILNVFLQILDGINYLHQHHISLSNLTMNSIIITPDLKIKMSTSKSSRFYDYSESHQIIKEDILKLGLFLLELVSIGRNFYSLTDPETIKQYIVNIENKTFRDILSYIFEYNKKLNIQGVYKAVGIKNPIYNIGRNDLLFLDPVVTEFLEGFSIMKKDLLLGANNKNKKEFYMYYLAEQKHVRNTIFNINDFSSEKGSTSKALDFVYEALKRKRGLTDKRREIIAKRLWTLPNIFNLLQCYKINSRSRISIEILTNKRFHESIARILKIMNLYFQRIGDYYEITVDEMGLKIEIQRFYTFESFVVEFTKNQGSDMDFVQIVEEIIDESKNI